MDHVTRDNQSSIISAVNERVSRKVKICELEPTMSSIDVVGLMIAKTPPRSFIHSKPDEGTTERMTFSGTIRDSAHDTVNFTCWGSQTFILASSSSCQVGDVITIINPKAVAKKENDERFHPTTTAGVNLSVNENFGQLALYGGWDKAKFLQLLHIPIKDSSDFYTLQDINYNGQALIGEHVNLLCGIRSKGEEREIINKDGKPVCKIELILFDQTHRSFFLTLWNEDLVVQSREWAVGSILFIADVKIIYNSYHKCVTSVADSKTIFTPNPQINEAERLAEYSSSMPLAGRGGSNIEDERNMQVDISGIKQVYTLEQIVTLLTTKPDDDKMGVYFHGILYPFITKFDIDGSEECVVYKCRKCMKELVDGLCVNINCTCAANGLAGIDSIPRYNIPIHLADHSGNVSFVYLPDKALQQMLELSAEEFCNLNEDEKTELKWKYMLERCKIYFSAPYPSYENPRPRLRIIHCELADPQEFVTTNMLLSP